MSSVPPKDRTRSWSVAEFEKYRQPLTEFVKSKILPPLDANECRRILVTAPVKSGKREIVEYIAVRDLSHCPRRVHAFVSAFHRVADEEQRDELKIHNLTVFSLRTKAQAVKCCAWIAAEIASGKQVVIHIDECDFGTGEKQILSSVYAQVRANINVSVILYSATPQEVLFSGEVNEEEYNGIIDDLFSSGEQIVYTPPATFCGPKRFLEAGLIINATPLFKKDGAKIVLTGQGKEIIVTLRAGLATGRNILVLRLSYSDLGGDKTQRTENKAIHQFLKRWQTVPELDGCIVIADKSEKDIPSTPSVIKQKIGWSDRRYWDMLTTDKPIIVVIDQTSSRSTEWACHGRVAAYHDYRNTIVFSTISQAQERVNHYSGKYPGGFQPIAVYGHLPSFKLSAGIIGYKEYLQQEWKAKKVDRRTAGSDTPAYHIVSTTPPHGIHPEYPTALSEADTEIALQDLGCAADIKMSARVGGAVRMKAVYAAEFARCDETGFPALKETLDDRFGKSFENPFARSKSEGLAADGRFKGYLRGWEVMDYDTDIKIQPGWGVDQGAPRLTICYKDGVLGIAIRYHTGTLKEENTLSTYGSIYQH